MSIQRRSASPKKKKSQPTDFIHAWSFMPRFPRATGTPFFQDASEGSIDHRLGFPF